MRPFIITFLCFFISAVLSSPLYIEHGSYSSSLLRRGEGHKVTGSHGIPPGAQALTGGPSRRPKLDSQRPQTVADAIKHKGKEIARGSMGIVYDLPNGFGTYEQRAVLKVMSIINTMPNIGEGYAAIEAFVEKEVRNLRQVDQLLAWGQQEIFPSTDNKEVYFIVMKYMGERGSDYGLSLEEQVRHLHITKEEYLEQYHMIHNDAKPDNIVFKMKCGEVEESHLIDWGAGSIEPGHTLPPAPKKEVIRGARATFIQKVSSCAIV